MWSKSQNISLNLNLFGKPKLRIIFCTEFWKNYQNISLKKCKRPLTVQNANFKNSIYIFCMYVCSCLQHLCASAFVYMWSSSQLMRLCLNHLASCINGSMRLVGPDGPNMVEGRVEYCSNGLWGTVSSSNFDSRDGEVVCRRLGYQHPSKSL